MPIVNMMQLLNTAQKEHKAIAAFEFWSLDSAQAIIRTAERVGVSAILQVGPAECVYLSLEEMVAIAKLAANKSSMEVGLHFDHGNSFEIVSGAIKAGFTSVMIDASHLSLEENISLTKRVVDLAHPLGISVEGELGRLAGSEGNVHVDTNDIRYTDPKESAYFVKETGIDCLAPAIGSAHGFYEWEPKLNIKRLDEIHRETQLPLVLHGGTGIPYDQIHEAIEHGICKINICTEFVAAYGQQYTKTQQQENYKYSIAGLFVPSQEAGMAVVEEKMRHFSCKR